MLQEMCCTIISLILIATASIYPEAHLGEEEEEEEDVSYEYPQINIHTVCAATVPELQTNTWGEAAFCTDRTKLFIGHWDKPFKCTTSIL